MLSRAPSHCSTACYTVPSPSAPVDSTYELSGCWRIDGCWIQRLCSPARDGGNLQRSSRGTAGNLLPTLIPFDVTVTRSARRSCGRYLGSRTSSPFSAARTRRSSSAMAPEPSAATQNLRMYGWDAGNGPSPSTSSTGTNGRIRAVARTEALPADTAFLTGGRATPLTESASVFIDSVLQKNVNERQVA